MKLPQETSVCKYAQCEPIIQNNYMRNTVYADKLHHKAVEVSFLNLETSLYLLYLVF